MSSPPGCGAAGKKSTHGRHGVSHVRVHAAWMDKTRNWLKCAPPSPSAGCVPPDPPHPPPNWGLLTFLLEWVGACRLLLWVGAWVGAGASTHFWVDACSFSLPWVCPSVCPFRCESSLSLAVSAYVYWSTCVPVCVGVRSVLRAGDFAPDHSGNLSAQMQINMPSSWPIALAKFRPPCCDIWQTMGPAWSPPNKKKTADVMKMTLKAEMATKRWMTMCWLTLFVLKLPQFLFWFLNNSGISSGTF